MYCVRDSHVSLSVMRVLKEELMIRVELYFIILLKFYIIINLRLFFWRMCVD